MPVNPKSIENLKPIQKGEVRNPKGKEPGTKNRATLFSKWLDMPVKVKGLDDIETDGTVEDRLVIAIIKKGIEDGDVNAAKEALDSVYGKNSDKVQHSSDPDAPVIFKVDGRFADSTEDS